MCVALLLALADANDDRKRSAMALWIMTTLLGAILLVSCAWLLARWRRRLTAPVRTPRSGSTPPVPDAWTEAGRRADPITVDFDLPPDEPRDDDEGTPPPHSHSPRPEQPE